MNAFEELKGLKVFEPYTFVRFGSFGFVFSVNFILQEIRVEQYAQYPESVVLVVKPKGKRKLIGFRILPRDSFLIWEGFENPKTEMYVETEVRGNGVVARKSLASFDVEYLKIALNSVEKKPLIVAGLKSEVENAV